jgi:hypothetical protein
MTIAQQGGPDRIEGAKKVDPQGKSRAARSLEGRDHMKFGDEALQFPLLRKSGLARDLDGEMRQ